MHQLKHFNIEGVLNFMESWELTHHQCEKAEMMRLLAQNHIGYSKQISLPALKLTATEANINEVFTAAQYLNDLANTKNLRVLLHSTSGVTRASTVLLAYMALFKAHEDWADSAKMCQWLRTSVELAQPNLHLVDRVVKARRDFQDKQVPLVELQKQKRLDQERKAKEDELREIRERLEKEEQERLRLEREAEIREMQHR